MPAFENENRQTLAAKQFIHGGGSVGNVANRWYDKTVQVSQNVVLTLFSFEVWPVCSL